MSGMPEILADGRGRQVAALALMALGQAAAAAVTAVAVRELFNIMGDNTAPMPWLALAAIPAAGCLFALLRWSERVAAERLGQEYAKVVRLRLFAHLARLPIREVNNRRSGTLSLRFVGDLGAIRNWVSHGLARLISAGIVLVAVAAVLYGLDHRIGIAASACATAGLVVMALLGPGLQRAHRRLRSRRARLSGDVAERLPHAPELRLLGRMAHERLRLAARSTDMITAALQRQRLAALLRAVPDLTQAFALALALWIALDSDMRAGDAAAALAALALLILPLRDLSGIWDRHAAWQTAQRRCALLLSAPPLASPARRRRRPRSRRGAAVAVSFEGATLGVLEGASAAVPPGRKVGITGRNGSGKSTLLLLAAGLEDAVSGRIRIDRVRSDKLGLAARREMVHYQGPRPPVLAGSLRRALTLGLRRRPSDEAITATAARCGLAESIQRLGGLDGRLSEAGRNLSAGELKRIMLTRCLLSQAPLLLLDEPDDALDRQGRELIPALLEGLDATVLLVSHDWSTLARMDEIWFLDGGRILERGTPDHLRKGGGPTARFFGLSEAC